jgi:prefoldin subunit 5
MTETEKKLREKYIKNIDYEIMDCKDYINSIQKDISVLQQDLVDYTEKLEGLKNIKKLFNNETEEGL